MGDWFDEHVALAFELSGVSFVALGVVSFVLPRRDLTLPFARHLWLLGIFGTLHGLLQFVERERIAGPSLTLTWIAAALLIGSYLAMLEFGRVACRASGRIPRWRAPVVYGLAAVATGALARAADHPLSGLTLGARYFVGAPGAALCAASLMLAAAEDRDRPDYATISRLLRVGAAAWLVYSVLIPFARVEGSGLPAWLPEAADFRAAVGVPVQLLRGCCAFVVTLVFAALVRRAGDVGVMDLMRVVNALNGFVYRCKNDRAYTVSYMSVGVMELSGYPAQDFMRNRRTWGDLIHPDDAEGVWQDVQSALAERRDFERSYRIRARDGQLRWVYERGRGMFDAEGRLLFLDGHVINDTVRMQALADLRAKDAEQTRLAVALARERDFATSVVATAPVVILVLDPSGKIDFANPYFERLSGYSLDEVRGRDWFASFLPERDRARIRELFETAAHGLPTRGNVNAIVTRSGEEREIEWFDQPIRGADGKLERLLAVGQDVTERKRSLEALHESQQKLRDILDNMFAFVALIAPDGTVLEVNRAPLATAGVAREHVLGRKLWETGFFGSVESRASVVAAFERAAAGETFRGDLTLQLGDRKMTVDIALVPVRDAAGEIAQIIGSAVDVSEQRAVERQSREFEQQLRRSQKLEALGTLAGGIAHDFNNALMVILGNVELAQIAKDRAARVAESLENIGRAGRRAQDLVQQILTFSRRQEQSLERVRLLPVVEEAWTMLRSTLPARITLELRALDADVEVLADASQIHQVIMNLATNAWHAMADGPGKLEISIQRELLAEPPAGVEGRLPKGRYARIEVRDNGCGMDERTLERVFEPFFTTKPPGQGTGLGLSVVHGIVSAHRGAVSVQSAPGRGTTVTVHLPEAAEAASAEVPGPRAPRVQGAGRHILYVDDEPAVVELAERMFRHMGYVITTHTSPTQALHAFGADPYGFALVVTDHSMPHMSGIELARALRAIRADVRIVLSSGFLSAEEAERALEAGITKIVAKPIAFDRLGQIVAELTGSSDERAVATGADRGRVH